LCIIVASSLLLLQEQRNRPVTRAQPDQSIDRIGSYQIRWDRIGSDRTSWIKLSWVELRNCIFYELFQAFILLYTKKKRVEWRNERTSFYSNFTNERTNCIVLTDWVCTSPAAPETCTSVRCTWGGQTVVYIEFLDQLKLKRKRKLNTEPQINYGYCSTDWKSHRSKRSYLCKLFF